MDYPFPLLFITPETTTEQIFDQEEQSQQQESQPYILPHPDKPGHYQCMLCKDFDKKTKRIVETHVKECLQIRQYKKKNQKEKQIVDTNLLYDLVIQLQKEVATMRQQIKDMKKQELHRINIQFWLNNHCNDPLPPQTFHKWRKSDIFHPSNEQLQIVFHHDIKKGIQDCIRQLLETENPATFPIRAFNKQRHVFYIYEYSPQTLTDEDEIPQWRKITKEEFHKWLETIQHKFLLKFEEWEQINQEWLENDTNNQERIKYFAKINKDLEMIEPQTIRNWFYDELQRPLKRVVELDFDN